MKKPEADKALYEAWETRESRIEARKKASIFGITSEKWDDVYPLTVALRSASKVASGRSRRRDEDLVVVPRFMLNYLTDALLAYAYQNDPKKQEEMKAYD